MLFYACMFLLRTSYSHSMYFLCDLNYSFLHTPKGKKMEFVDWKIFKFLWSLFMWDERKMSRRNVLDKWKQFLELQENNSFYICINIRVSTNVRNFKRSHKCIHKTVSNAGIIRIYAVKKRPNMHICVRIIRICKMCVETLMDMSKKGSFLVNPEFKTRMLFHNLMQPSGGGGKMLQILE